MIYENNKKLIPKLRFPEFQTAGEWEEKKLEELITSFNTGLNPRNFFKLNTEDAKNYYITAKEIQNNSIIFNENTDKINNNALMLCNNRSNLEVGDILFSGTGTIGKIYIIKEQPNNWNINESIYAIKPNKEILKSDFLFYSLQSPYIKNMYSLKIKGSIIQSLPIREMKNLNILLPTLPEQQKIASFLTSADELIGAERRKLEALKK
ncbi:restriction endonuclease subunit S, partial [uncultured Brachyspira sp.]